MLSFGDEGEARRGEVRRGEVRRGEVRRGEVRRGEQKLGLLRPWKRGPTVCWRDAVQRLQITRPQNDDKSSRPHSVKHS